jgi:hypothetical protein
MYTYMYTTPMYISQFSQVNSKQRAYVPKFEFVEAQQSHSLFSKANSSHSVGESLSPFEFAGGGGHHHDAKMTFIGNHRAAVSNRI